MAEQMDTRARHAAVLDAAKMQLKDGDVAGYWKSLEQISPHYARLAGSVARGGAHGKGARERLQEKAQDRLGRRLSEQEMDAIEYDIADADLTLREDSLGKDGDAGLTLGETARYHQAVFQNKDLPDDTYSLNDLAETMGDDADEVADTDPDFISKNAELSGKSPTEFLKTGWSYLGDTSDSYLQDWLGIDIRPQEQIDPNNTDKGFGPHADEGQSPDGDDAETSDAPTESPEVSQLKNDLMPSEKEGARAELLYKSADQLTDEEVTDLGHWYHDLQPSDPLRETLDQKRRDFYSLTYGDDLAKTDATGRMVEPELKRPVPETPTPANAASGGTLTDGIKRIAGTLVKAAAEQGAGETVKGLQTGLNLGGASLKVDGVAGPKTRGALMSSLAEKGTGKTEEASALGAFKRFAESERSAGGSASGLKKKVEESVQPLFATSKSKVAAEALQTGLNGLGAEAAKAKKMPEPEALKIDGDIGPKTTDAFRTMLLEHGPERLTKRFGEELGFEF